MNDQLKAVQDILLEAVEIADARERAAFLSKACGTDLALRREVEELLQAEAEAGPFLPDSPGTNAAQVALAGAAGSLAPYSGPLQVPLTEKPGDRIGRYKLLQKIGEGGCGVVYMAEQEQPVRRKLALKVIKLGMDTKSVVARFEAERQALALMDHPSIAKVLDAGATGTGRPFFVMELVRGIKITDYCDQNQLPTRERLELFIRVCQAVQHAHQKGIIHRDLKPSNILVTVNDDVPVPKVIDFGIAKATEGRLTDQTLFTAFEQFLGTPAYMSPEQAAMTSLDIDTRSDIYSLGVLLYELLTGKTPFDTKALLASGLDELRRTIQEKEPVRPSTRLTMDLGAANGRLRPHSATDRAATHRLALEQRGLINLIRGDLDSIVMKCLEKDRARRYETANGLARDIQRHLDNEPVLARPPSRLYEFQKTVQRHKAGFGATAAVIAALAGGALVSSVEAVRARRAEREQSQLRQQAVAQEKKAETEANKSRQIAQFLKDMLHGVGPAVALGRDATMLRELLDKTAERVSRDLTNQPQVEWEIRKTLGQVYHEWGQYKQAAAMYRHALALYRQLRGDDDLEVADLLNRLVVALMFGEELVEAERIGLEEVALYKRLRGPDHPDVGNALDTLAGVVWKAGRLAEAENIERDALAKFQGEGTNQDRLLAMALGNLAAMVWTQGKMAEAESLAREDLAVKSRMPDSTGPEVAISLNNLARIVGAEGKLAEAEERHRQALDLRKKYYGDDHPLVAQSLGNLVPVLERRGKLAEAERLAHECLAICEKVFPDNWWTFYTQSLLGSSLLAQKKYEQAEPWLLSGYKGMEQRKSRISYDCKPRLRRALERLAQFYDETARPDEAAEWKQKLAELKSAETQQEAAATEM